MNRPLLLAALALALIVGGCSEGTEQPKPDASDETATSPPSDTQAPELWLEEQPLEGSDAAWERVHTWTPEETDHFGAASATYFLEDVGDSPAGARVIDRTTGRLLIDRGVRRPGWEQDDMVLVDDALVSLTLNFDKRRSRLSGYQLPGGKPVRWLPPGGIASVWPEIGAGDGWLVYLDDSPPMCVRGVDTATGRTVKVTCGEPNEILDDPYVTGSQVTYTKLVNRDSRKNRCKTIAAYDLEAEEEYAASLTAIANEHAQCTVWSGRLLRDGLFWEEVDPSQSMGTSVGYWVGADGVITNLRSMEQESMVECNGALYWFGTKRPPEGGETGTVIRWIPGEPAAAEVLDPGPDRIASDLVCTDGRYVSTRVDNLDGRPVRGELLVLDTGGE